VELVVNNYLSQIVPLVTNTPKYKSHEPVRKLVPTDDKDGNNLFPSQVCVDVAGAPVLLLTDFKDFGSVRDPFFPPILDCLSDPVESDPGLSRQFADL
jgi:hypothetical protein